MTAIVRGVEFSVPQRTSNVLYDILECVNDKQFNWYNTIGQDEIYLEHMGRLLFDKDFYKGEDFYQLIQKDHYVIFLKLQAYCKNGIFSEVHTYNEFEESDCQLLLLIYDSKWFEIYAKDKTLVQALYEKAASLGYSDIHYKTDDNDHRTKMDVIGY